MAATTKGLTLRCTRLATAGFARFRERVNSNIIRTQGREQAMGLFDRLKALVAAPPTPIASLGHPILGQLVYDNEVEAWRVSVTTPAGPLPFLLYGDSEPGAAVLSKAEDMVRSSGTFLESVAAFLQAEAKAQTAKAQTEAAGEIQRLRLQDVSLFPAKGSGPVTGMVYFEGPDEHRVWRCDFDGDRLHHLGFDS